MGRKGERVDEWVEASIIWGKGVAGCIMTFVLGCQYVSAFYEYLFVGLIGLGPAMKGILIMTLQLITPHVWIIVCFILIIASNIAYIWPIYYGHNAHITFDWQSDINFHLCLRFVYVFCYYWVRGISVSDFGIEACNYFLIIRAPWLGVTSIYYLIFVRHWLTSHISETFYLLFETVIKYNICVVLQLFRQPEVLLQSVTRIVCWLQLVQLHHKRSVTFNSPVTRG